MLFKIEKRGANVVKTCSSLFTLKSNGYVCRSATLYSQITFTDASLYFNGKYRPIIVWNTLFCFNLLERTDPSKWNSWFYLIGTDRFKLFETDWHCMPFYSLITFRYSAIAILAARCALIRLEWACVHESCAESTSTMLAFPSL